MARFCIGLCMALVACAGDCSAAGPLGKSRFGGLGGGMKPGGMQNPQLLQRLDKNGNGRIDPEELQQAQQGAAAAKGQLLQRFDKNGNGQLDPDERQSAAAALQNRQNGGPAGDVKERLLQRFDKDGDGKLNESERAEARQAAEKLQKSKVK